MVFSSRRSALTLSNFLLVGESKAQAIPRVKIALINSAELFTHPADLTYCSKSLILASSPLVLFSREVLMNSSSFSRSSWVLATSFWSFLRTSMILSHFSNEDCKSSTCLLIAQFQILQSFSGWSTQTPFQMKVFLKLSFLMVLLALFLVESARRETS